MCGVFIIFLFLAFFGSIEAQDVSNHDDKSKADGFNGIFISKRTEHTSLVNGIVEKFYSEMGLVPCDNMEEAKKSCGFWRVGKADEKDAVEHFYNSDKIKKHHALNVIPGHPILGKKGAFTDLMKMFDRHPDNLFDFRSEYFYPKSFSLSERSIKNLERYRKFINRNIRQRNKCVKGNKGGGSDEPMYWIMKPTYFGKGEGIEVLHERDVLGWLEEYEANGLKKSFEITQLKGGTTNVEMNFIAQTYVHNPLLIEGRKFHFRLYWAILSTNPFRSLLFRGGGRILISGFDYNLENLTMTPKHLTNWNQQIQYLEKTDPEFDVGELDMNDNSFVDTIDMLDGVVREQGLWDGEEDFREGWVYPEAQKAMSYVTRAFLEVMKGSSKREKRKYISYDLFGTDFMLDENLKLYLLEINHRPWPGETFAQQAFEELFLLTRELQEHRRDNEKDILRDFETRKKFEWLVNEVVDDHELFHFEDDEDEL